MRRNIAFVMVVLFSMYSFGCIDEDKEEPSGIVKIGMERKEAEELLMAHDATEAFLSIIIPRGSKDCYKSYALPNKPYVVVVYGEKNGKEVVKELSLYYEYGHKGHPDNKWLNVKEVDLRNISQDAGLGQL